MMTRSLWRFSALAVLLLGIACGPIRKKQVVEEFPLDEAEPDLPIGKYGEIAALSPVFFDYDSVSLSEAARDTLAENAKWLVGHSSVTILIEGHCDERGTTAYNLALSDRRAKTTRGYLIRLGIRGKRIQTLPYGEEKPFCAEATEECWRQNRQAHFKGQIPKPPGKKEKEQKKR